MRLVYRAVSSPEVCALSSGLLLGCGFVVPSLWLLALVGCIPLFFILSDTRTSLGRVIGSLIIAGVVLYGMIFSFVWTVLPLDWIPVPHFPGVLFVNLTWGISVVAFMIPFVLWGLCVRWANLLNRMDGIVFIPLLWVISECMAAYLYSVVNTGPGALWGVHMSFAFVGNLLANDIALLQFASLGGVFLLSGVVMILNVGVWFLLTRRIALVYKGIIVVVVLCLWGMLTLWYVYQPNETSEESRALNIAVMSIYPHDHADIHGVIDPIWMMQMLESASTQPLDMIVFPEGRGVFNPRMGDVYATSTSSHADYPRTTNAVFVTSGQYRDDGGIMSQVQYVQHGMVLATSSKDFIMPIGEYIPTLYHTAFSFLSNDAYTQAAQELRGYVSGHRSGPVLIHDIPVATLFCNEVMSPFLYAEEVSAGAQILVNISSNVWFHGSPRAARHLLNIAKIRAVESRRWYVQSSVDAPARILSPYGQEVRTSQAEQTPVVVYAIPSREEMTWYTFFTRLFTW
jgi:apolipoprotein N-acyltransferase